MFTTYISVRFCLTESWFDESLFFTLWGFQVEVFWVVTPCGVVVGYQRFGGPCCLHFQGEAAGVEEKGYRYTNSITRRHNLEHLDLEHNSRVP